MRASFWLLPLLLTSAGAAFAADESGPEVAVAEDCPLEFAIVEEAPAPQLPAVATPEPVSYEVKTPPLRALTPHRELIDRDLDALFPNAHNAISLYTYFRKARGVREWRTQGQPGVQRSEGMAYLNALEEYWSGWANSYSKAQNAWAQREIRLIRASPEKREAAFDLIQRAMPLYVDALKAVQDRYAGYYPGRPDPPLSIGSYVKKRMRAIQADLNEAYPPLSPLDRFEMKWNDWVADAKARDGKPSADPGDIARAQSERLVAINEVLSKMAKLDLPNGRTFKQLFKAKDAIRSETLRTLPSAAKRQQEQLEILREEVRQVQDEIKNDSAAHGASYAQLRAAEMTARNIDSMMGYLLRVESFALTGGRDASAFPARPPLSFWQRLGRLLRLRR